MLNLTNQFKDKHLESAYQRYSQRQRQKSLVILNIIDIVLKVIFLVAYFYAESTTSVHHHSSAEPAALHGHNESGTQAVNANNSGNGGTIITTHAVPDFSAAAALHLGKFFVFFLAGS